MNLVRTAMRLAASPQGRRAVAQAKRWAERPENQERIRSVVDRARLELRNLQGQRGEGPSSSTGRASYDEPGRRDSA